MGAQCPSPTGLSAGLPSPIPPLRWRLVLTAPNLLLHYLVEGLTLLFSFPVTSSGECVDCCLGVPVIYLSLLNSGRLGFGCDHIYFVSLKMRLTPTALIGHFCEGATVAVKQQRNNWPLAGLNVTLISVAVRSNQR